MILAAIVIAADQATKSAIVAALEVGESRPLLGDLLQLTHVRNTGAAFGMLRGLGGLLGLVALVGIIVFAAIIVRNPPPLTTLGASLVASGASGNLIDRLIRDGGVVDFVDFRYWPAFNVADSAITVGALILLYAGMKEGSGEPEREGDERAAQGT